MLNTPQKKPVYIVDGARTPFLKSKNTPGPFSAADLAVQAGNGLMLRQKIHPTQFDEVILGCASPSPDEVNIARVAALRIGCGNKVPAWTVMRNCASGMQALDSALTNIQLGRSHIVLAGGVDALSRAPLLFSDQMVQWLASWYAARSTIKKIALLKSFRPKYLAPVIGLMKGLTDPIVGQLMGQTAENLAYKFGITRAQMDAYANRSHQRLNTATAESYFADEIIPIIDDKGNAYSYDDGLRRDSSVENLARLKPFFDRKHGNVTAGNSSQVSDGACWLILASEEAVEHCGLRPLGRIVDSQWAGLAPQEMGLGPVHATTPILQRHGLALEDIDAWEINEAFAAQVLACIAAWKDDNYCQQNLGLPGALGSLDERLLNMDGGAIAQGHPVGASGARIVLHLLHVLRRTAGKRGIASICIGGGQGGAMLVEKI